jgi:hypothetical protein
MTSKPTKRQIAIAEHFVKKVLNEGSIPEESIESIEYWAEQTALKAQYLKNKIKTLNPQQVRMQLQGLGKFIELMTAEINK